jgi:probable HAF family extracellular repeat protein
VNLYSIIDLGTPISPPGFYVQPMAINNRGYVAGTALPLPGAGGSTRPLLRDPSGQLHDLGDTDGQGAQVANLNDDNQVVGICFYGPEAMQGWKPVRWVPGGGIDQLAMLGTGFRPTGEALGINNNAQVVGYSFTGAGTPRAVLWNPAPAQLTDLGALPGRTGAAATAISANGQVVGISGFAYGEPEHAFRWDQAGGMIDLGTFGSDFSYPMDINAAGHVVGFSTYAPGQANHAFRWDPTSGALTDLGGLPAGTASYAYAINDHGLIVGMAKNATGQSRAVLWNGHNPIQDLEASLVNGSGWRLTAGVDVNDSGQIVGVGLLNGEFRGFLLEPVPVLSDHERLYATVAHIVGGIIDDAGGVYIGPNGQPVPLGPWGPMRSRAPGPPREGVLGVLIAELAPLVHERRAREQASKLAQMLFEQLGAHPRASR